MFFCRDKTFTGVIFAGFFFALLSMLSAGRSPVEAAEPPHQSEEERIGEKAAKEIEKSLKLSKDDPEIPRLESIANEIAKYTQRPEIRYTIKVVESKGINAFTIPGGRIYITQGALKAVESEDELAAILAHEIAHNALKHALQQRDKANRADAGVMAAVLAGVLSNRGEIALMATQLQEGALNQYGRKAEFEADEQGLNYLSHTKYNPVALLTVLEGLAAMEESGLRSEVVTTGDTHPLARDRARRLADLLIARGVDIAAQRRRVTERFKVGILEIEQGGDKLWQITLNDKPVFIPAAADGNLSPQARADAYAANLRSAFNQGIQLIDLKLELQGEGYGLKAREQSLITVLPGDAAFHQQSARTLAEQAKKTIDLALYAETLSRPF